jgi:aminodeoxyfutalosine deaminase
VSAEPKIELHIHLEGSVRPATLLEIARRNDVPLPVDTVDDLAKLYHFTDFSQFIQIWLMTTQCLRTADDFRRITVEYAAEAADHGAVYLEAVVSPAQWVAFGQATWDEILTGYVEGAAEARERFGVTVNFTPDLYRGLDPEIAEECARVCVRYRDRGVVGLGIGGPEKDMSIEPYRTAFAIARDGGLGVVPHSGEADGPASMREVLTLDPARIRHGIRAVEDPEVLAEIVERGLVLDVCPTSNLRTGVVASLAEHPLPRLRAAGVPCTINTDDPAMFDTDLGREFEVAAGLGVSARDAFAAGVAGALCDEATRGRLAALAQ